VYPFDLFGGKFFDDLEVGAKLFLDAVALSLLLFFEFQFLGSVRYEG
jgi:hypothetical protein